MSKGRIPVILLGVLMLAALFMRRVVHPAYSPGATLQVESGAREMKAASDEPRVLGTLKPFILKERSGKPVGLADLKNRVWIADFIYTRCSDDCPLLTERMKKLQETLLVEPKITLVSFSVDPAHDTPAVLEKYARHYGADKERWFFITGDKAAIAKIVKKDFHLPAVDKEGAAIHTNKFVLIDGLGRIRGYYDSTDAEAIDLLKRQARDLAHGKS